MRLSFQSSAGETEHNPCQFPDMPAQGTKGGCASTFAHRLALRHGLTQSDDCTGWSDAGLDARLLRDLAGGAGCACDRQTDSRREGSASTLGYNQGYERNG